MVKRTQPVSNVSLPPVTRDEGKVLLLILIMMMMLIMIMLAMINIALKTSQNLRGEAFETD